MKASLMACLLGLALAVPVSAAEWHTDFNAAKAKARKENKLLLMDFTGSDWCPPCKQMKKDVLDQKAFLDYAGTNLVLVQVDFPRRKSIGAAQKKANDALQSKFGIEGFPTYIVLSPEGKEIGRHLGYLQGGPAAMINLIETSRKKAGIKS